MEQRKLGDRTDDCLRKLKSYWIVRGWEDACSSDQKKSEEDGRTKTEEQQKRVAVEEKRNRKQEEEKVHYEAVMRRTLERSQRLEQRQKRWSWGGALATENENSNGVPEHSLTPPLNLSDCPPPPSDQQASTEDGSAIDKHSPSIANVMKSGMSKRLSSSSTALFNSPDKSTVDTKRSSSLNRLAGNPRPSQSDKMEELQARRSLNSPLESNVISRLLTPTQSSLARSKSAATLSEAGQSSAESHLCPRSASARPINPPVNPPNKPLRSRSTDRQTPTPEAKDTTIAAIQKQIKEKRPSSPASTSRRRSPSPNLSKKLSWPASTGTPKSSSPATGAKRPPSPPSTGAKRSTSPSTVKSSPKNGAASPSSFRQHPPSPPSIQKPLPINRVPAASTAAKKKIEKEGKPKAKAEGVGSEHRIEPLAPSSKTKDPEQKPGTTSAEKAAKILAVNRRLAREQKEREEQEKLQLEEAKRCREEQLKREAAEMRAHRREEAQRQEEKGKLADESEKEAEEERICREQEERERSAEMQLQREEAEAKASEETERQRVERDRITQQLQQERLARRKRIAEIMTRTRTPDQGESKKADSGAAEESSEDEPRNYDADDVDSTDEIDELQENVQECAEWSDEAAVGEETELNGVDKTNDMRDCLNKEHTVDMSPVLKEDCDVSERLHVNEVGESVGHPNGKASTWILQDYIDLDVCSKVTKLAVTPCNADDYNQTLIDTAGIPDSHIIALEENGGVTSLTKPIEETSGL
ncbi:ensconsin [Scyliorhinus canicula]|uniref:ensconsin n=1 Tax=Scyliorhinus canicula TaxID=7830 RepID=UPI0018F3F9A0|nr:ensconsin [Scyliorhinus canicula]